MSMHEITMTVNGKKRTINVKSNELLLNVLRDRLCLTGAKYGCGIGECGACSVLINGRAVLSCLKLAVSCDGADIVTAEGLAKNGELNSVQKAFIDNNAIQCGFCTPGMVVTATALINENKNPSEVEVKEYMRGNFCRCTGYIQIVTAVLDAAKREREEQ
ncbi:MAG: (2Fe-2S)-binding protein [Clostridia bacterium]